MFSRAPTPTLRYQHRLPLVKLYNPIFSISPTVVSVPPQPQSQFHPRRAFTLLPANPGLRRRRFQSRRHKPFNPRSPLAPENLIMTSKNGGPPDTNINHDDAKAYWQSVDADVNGMLGGFPYVSRIDLRGSRAFLVKLGVLGEEGDGEMTERKGRLGRVVDCGAGIGRITKGLLNDISDQVDIVEPIEKFSDKLKGQPGIGGIFNVGLEEWTPEEGVYDLIWNQWCLGHLTDSQLVDYMGRCGKGLKSGGLVIVKENISTGFEDLFDETDSSVTRTENKLKKLFIEARMSVVRTEIQRGMPKELYPVRMWALKPFRPHRPSQT